MSEPTRIIGPETRTIAGPHSGWVRVEPAFNTGEYAVRLVGSPLVTLTAELADELVQEIRRHGRQGEWWAERHAECVAPTECVISGDGMCSSDPVGGPTSRRQCGCTYLNHLNDCALGGES